MEGFNSDKFSSRSSKSGCSKVLNVTEAKQRKSKKKKKSRRGSKKSFVSPEGVKITSDEESISLRIGENKISTESYYETSNFSSTVKLPFLISGKGISTFNNTGLSPDLSTSATYTLPTIKQLSNGYSHDHETISSLAEEINNITIKHKQSSKNNSRPRNNINKQNGSKQSRSSNKEKYISKTAPMNNAVSPPFADLSSIDSAKLINPNQLHSKSVNPNNESLRWEYALDDSEEEQEHIRIYKINRRKRYLAAAQAKGLSWAVNCTINSSFQLPDDRGLESLRFNTSSYTDYRPIKTFGISQVHGMMGASMLEC